VRRRRGVGGRDDQIGWEDVDWEEGGADGRSGSGGRDGRRGVAAGPSRREPNAEAVELAAEGVDGKSASRAELDVGQPRAVKLRQHGRPVELAR